MLERSYVRHTGHLAKICRLSVNRGGEVRCERVWLPRHCSNLEPGGRRSKFMKRCNCAREKCTQENGPSVRAHPLRSEASAGSKPLSPPRYCQILLFQQRIKELEADSGISPRD